MYDILIIGAGPAGLAAAIYGRRAGKSVLIIEKESFGGQINTLKCLFELGDHILCDLVNLTVSSINGCGCIS